MKEFQGEESVARRGTTVLTPTAALERGASCSRVACGREPPHEISGMNVVAPAALRGVALIGLYSSAALEAGIFVLQRARPSLCSKTPSGACLAELRCLLRDYRRDDPELAFSK